ncbi:MAG TPA: hypothetical protein VN764_11335 [Polyangiaceae bacterium]|nr:hypothetical protein [Polyangiaceae bacterium]
MTVTGPVRSWWRLGWIGALISSAAAGSPAGQPDPALLAVEAPARLGLTHRYAGPPTRVLHIPHHAAGWRQAGLAPIRGVTIGPIESYLQPGRGYGSVRFAEMLDEVARLGGNWISLTAFARMADNKSVGIDAAFEQPWSVTRQAILRSVQLAHARGFRVFLVPHLWLESGQWRAEMAHASPARFLQFARNYTQLVLPWAKLAEEAGVDLFAVGVELRSWVTTSRAGSFVELIAEVRDVYHGPITYAANWDDVDDTVVWGELDVIGINAFYPLHWEDNASYAQVEAGGYRVRAQVEALAQRYERSVVFSEFGYTTRKNTEIKPWLWPEELGRVTRDEDAQERAYEALLGAMHEAPGFNGTFVWRMYADPADLSQEPDWGFSPWGKRAAGQLRRTYRRAERDEAFRSDHLF